MKMNRKPVVFFMSLMFESFKNRNKFGKPAIFLHLEYTREKTATIVKTLKKEIKNFVLTN